MVKGNRVKIKNINMEDYFQLTDIVRETIEIYYGQEGIVLNNNSKLVRVGFENGVEIIPAVLLDEIPQKVGIAIYKIDDQLANFKIFSTLKKAEEEIFEYENRDGLEKSAHELEVL